MGWKLGGVSLLLLGCQEGPYLHVEQFITRPGGTEEAMGIACMSGEKGEGMGGGLARTMPGAGGEADMPALSYSFSYEGTGNGVRLKVELADGKVLTNKLYDAAFIESGRKDEVKVDTGSDVLRFQAWGVPDCR